MAIIISSADIGLYLKRIKKYYELLWPGVDMYDGITDIYFNSLEDFNNFFSSKNYIEKVHPDESNFIDLENVVVLVSKETIIK